MMPMSMRDMARLDSHAADESVAGTRGLRRIGGLVMLHHPLRTRGPDGLPQVPPVQGAGPDIRPAVLVIVLPLRRDILHVRGYDAVSVAPQPLFGIGAAPYQPGDVHLPSERAALGRLEDQLQGGLRAVLRCELPVVVVIAEGDPLVAHVLGDLAELAPQGAPERSVALPLFLRHARHEELVEAQGAARPYHNVRPFPQRRQANVAGGYLETARVELGAHVLSVVQLGTDRLDVTVAGLLDGVQHAVELAQRAQRVQLDREYVGIAHRGPFVVSGIRGGGSVL